MTKPSSSVESQATTRSKGVQKIRTMIEGFDDISHGGLPVGRSTLVSGTSGTGKTLLAVQFLYHGLTYFDEPGVFVTFEESPADIIDNTTWSLQVTFGCSPFCLA